MGAALPKNDKQGGLPHALQDGFQSRFRRRWALALGAVAALSAPAAAQTYTIGANPQGSMFYAAAAALAKVGVDKTGLQFRVAPYSGSSTYIPKVNSGELAFGMSNGAEYSFAYNGTELFKGHENKNLRSVMFTFALTNGFAVRNDSEIKTPADLKGKKVPGIYSSGSIFAYLQRAWLAAAGMIGKGRDHRPRLQFRGRHQGLHGRAHRRRLHPVQFRHRQAGDGEDSRRLALSVDRHRAERRRQGERGAADRAHRDDQTRQERHRHRSASRPP